MTAQPTDAQAERLQRLAQRRGTSATGATVGASGSRRHTAPRATGRRRRPAVGRVLVTGLATSGFLTTLGTIARADAREEDEAAAAAAAREAAAAAVEVRTIDTTVWVDEAGTPIGAEATTTVAVTTAIGAATSTSVERADQTATTAPASDPTTSTAATTEPSTTAAAAELPPSLAPPPTATAAPVRRDRASASTPDAAAATATAPPATAATAPAAAEPVVTEACRDRRPRHSGTGVDGGTGVDAGTGRHRSARAAPGAAAGGDGSAPAPVVTQPPGPPPTLAPEPPSCQGSQCS